MKLGSPTHEGLRKPRRRVKPEPSPPRWTACAAYRQDSGIQKVIVHQFDELHELHELIEEGPSWDALDKITIVLTVERGQMTIEQCEAA